MSQENDKYEQQILFNEAPDLSNVQADIDSQPENQVILPEAAWQPIDENLTEDIIELKKSKPRWLWRLAGVSFLTLLVYELINFLILGFSNSPIITSIYSMFFAAIAGISGLALLKELRGLRQFKLQTKNQHKAAQLLANETFFDAKTFCQKISCKLPSDAVEEHQQMFEDNIGEELTEQEILTLYSKQVLSHVDEQALAQVAKFSTEAVVLVAVSPVAIIDMLVLMWRNLRMLDKIAGLYGVRLGYWSRLKLIKHVFTNMAYAGASEIIADVGLDLLGVETLGRLSTRAAQGLGAGMLTARLGIKTINLCRPIPFVDKPPGISQVRQQVIAQVKALLTSKVK
ncbi:TIGR01620 family protein [Thalassotalea fonticola]|uniref:TIGR01620 family protein n=1 Tax=Thalassotalea fonticola TaxID=3065649 RepID=A0ABZ0GPF2_9GAMM|nr:TIGR01620 family protein [Colwelliaceae bacterium S1-1]